MTRVLRFKASRPVYRRGGLLLSSANWVLVEDLHDLTKANALALVEDPVVIFEGEVEPGVWERPSNEHRQDIAENLRALIAREAQQDTEAKPAAPAAGEGNGQVQTALVADAGGAGENPPANDPPPAPIAPIGRTAAEPVTTTPATPAAKTGGKATGAKAAKPKKPAAKQPASAPKAAE